jgi:hypothetical protein
MREFGIEVVVIGLKFMSLDMAISGTLMASDTHQHPVDFAHASP